MTAASPAESRTDWVDVAKGLCIVLVVMMHSTLGVEAAMGRTGWLGAVVEWAKPFRMPDFFLISGLFLAKVIDRPWRTYLDKKVVHFVYFYLLWVTIQIAAKSAGAPAAMPGLWLSAMVEPIGTLWFIYILPIFFVLTRLLTRFPAWAVFAGAAALEILPIHTGHFLLDEFCSRYVYFLAGFMGARFVFRLADEARGAVVPALTWLAVWAVAHTLAIYAGVAELPFLSLGLGLLGAAAVVTVSALVTGRAAGRALAFAGRNSIAVYLAFFLPMAATRAILIKTGIAADVGTVSLIVTTVAVLVPLALAVLVRGTPFAFLFKRPGWAHLSGQARHGKPARLQAAE